MKKNRITRRSFMKKGAELGSAAVVGSTLFNQGCGKPGKTDEPSAPGEALFEIAAVKGDDDSKITRKAVGLLGGMERFVSKGAKVCILANAQRNNPGTYTHPGVLGAAIDMCMKAGAKEVNCLSWLPRENWESTGLDKAAAEAGADLKIVDLKDESLFRPVSVPDGVVLKQARIMELFFENDLFINMPITKDHAGNRFTGTMKNLMGLNSPATNRKFHTGNFKNDDIGHLDQCIADLNTVIKPDLCIVDATEIIITNGPFGPGKLHRPRKVVAGVDRVAVDAYCSTLWGLKPEEIIMIEKAHRHGLGEIDFSKKRLKEVVL